MYGRKMIRNSVTPCQVGFILCIAYPDVIQLPGGEAIRMNLGLKYLKMSLSVRRERDRSFEGFLIGGVSVIKGWSGKGDRKGKDSVGFSI